MESDEGLRTVECLKGRLLAERQASKTAKQDAELMGNKLMELEKELKEETKLRNKAEKRLKLLRKKLESLKLLPSLEESEHCAVSCVSSTSSSGTKVPDRTASMSQNASSSGHEDPNSSSLEDDGSVDNSLALVPLFLPETKVTPEIKIVGKSTGEVVETLKHARERIQSSMERRQIIRVGAILNS
ncbi:hypothetical protein HRI_000804700 [Hibiscus trionum]|uniref:Uncharacterized protein n=1 Tax=Hibiscus trionum TaxID=183268 RepID=A0A9W7H5E1_HIBTR|nr:hypothetical protein HRI_000804700 [Hibiscus trionum]